MDGGDSRSGTLPLRAKELVVAAIETSTTGPMEESMDAVKCRMTASEIGVFDIMGPLQGSL